MVVDTSALVAILLGESERDEFEDIILRSDVAVTSAVVLVETDLVVRGRRRDPDASDLDRLLDHLRLAVQPFGVEQASVARQAARSYGKGRHRAALNFGDCLVYALAKVRDDALLFKGEDFTLTDLRAAWRP